MAEIRTVTTLKRKRDEISASIRMYEKKIAQARADMAHCAAAIRIFEASERPKDLAQYVDHYGCSRACVAGKACAPHPSDR